MRHLVLALCVACGAQDAAPSVRAPLLEHGAPGLAAPHGGPIDLVAITDRGDAALTADFFAEIRLWPTLDGKREPVVVRGARPVQLALGRAGTQLVAALLDEAGTVDVLRFDADGGLLGRAQLPGDPPVDEVIAVDGGSLLVRRADHSIERFDPRGHPTGRLMLASGERVVSLAARRDHAVAGIATGSDTRARRVRTIALGSKLAWSGSAELPVALERLAITPDGTRIAGISAPGTGVVIELAPRPTVVGTVTMNVQQTIPVQRDPLPMASAVIGFYDDSNAVIGGPGEIRWLFGPKPPWTATDPRPDAPEAQIAVGDHVVAAHSATLLLAEPLSHRYLGYRWLGEGLPSSDLRIFNGGVVTVEGPVWVDRKLDLLPGTRELERRDLEIMLDGHHVLYMHSGYERPIVTRVVVVDISTGAETELARLANVAAPIWDAATHVLAIPQDNDVLRYRLTLDPVTATPLRTLAQVGGLMRFYLTDPARANGVVAIGETFDRPPRANIYKLAGDDTGKPIKPAKLRLGGPIGAFDLAATIYDLRDTSTGVTRAGKPAGTLPITNITTASHDGTLLARGQANSVTVFDADGHQRWSQPLWHAGPVAFSADDRWLLVEAEGGATVSYDAQTGERIAMRCGWGFGRYERDVTSTASNMPSACAAP